MIICASHRNKGVPVSSTARTPRGARGQPAPSRHNRGNDTCPVARPRASPVSLRTARRPAPPPRRNSVRTSPAYRLDFPFRLIFLGIHLLNFFQDLVPVPLQPHDD